MKRKGITLYKRRMRQAYLFVVPWIIGFFLFFFYPITQSFWLSFRRIVQVWTLQTEAAGFDNYVRALTIDTRFVPVLLKSLQVTFINTPAIIIFSLFISIVLNKKFKGRTFFRGVFFLPVLLGSGIVMNQLLGQGVDVKSISMAKDIIMPKEVMAYLGMDIFNIIQKIMDAISLILWKSGVQIILFLAGLQGISSTLYESARCDSANEWEMFWKITLPMISPVILLNVVYTLIDSFTDAGNPIVAYIAEISTKQFAFEYASALSWIYFVVIVFTVLIIFMLRKGTVYEPGSR